MAGTTFGVRYIFRNMPRILEDISDCPMAAYELPQTASIPCGAIFTLTNPSSASRVNAAAIAAYPPFATCSISSTRHEPSATIRTRS
jgi:hypothetical protein